MTEQLSLFTIHPVQVSKPISDPYWDEIECANLDQLTQTNKQICDDLGGLLSSSQLPKSVAVGDWVKVSLEWLDRCREAVDRRFHKYYQHKSKQDLICKVIGLSEGKGVYIPRGPQRFFFVPEKYFEIAPQHKEQDSWNPADFGGVPHKADGDQLTIFYDDSHEPPDPDDYPNLTDYEQACGEWQLLVGAQVNTDTQPDTVESRIGAQVNTDTKKSAPQHDKPTHWVEKYWVQREGNRYWYYRYCWMTGRKKSRRYIGSVESARAQNRKLEIESAIADGDIPSEIQNLMRSWKS